MHGRIMVISLLPPPSEEFFFFPEGKDAERLGLLAVVVFAPPTFTHIKETVTPGKDWGRVIMMEPSLRWLPLSHTRSVILFVFHSFFLP